MPSKIRMNNRNVMKQAQLVIADAEHGVVIPSGALHRIPAAKQTVQELNLKTLYYGWPGIVRTHGGDLLVSASEGILHVDPYRREVIVRSSDNGLTWSEPTVMFDSITDDRDIALNCLPDGMIVATWFSSDFWSRPKPYPYMRPEWEPLREQIKRDTFRALCRGWLRRSPDGGKTWEEHIHPTLVGQHAGPTVLGNGDLIYLGPYCVEDGNKMVSTLSTDGGRTWSIIGELDVPRYYDEVTAKYYTVLNENNVVEAAPGNLIVAFRGNHAEKHLNIHFAHSHDGGYTWTAPKDSGVSGQPPYLLKLKSGAILCLFGCRIKPSRIGGILSYDGGKTWDIERELAIARCELSEGIDMGYPVAIELDSGEIFCVYYASPNQNTKNGKMIDPSQWGIRSTRFRMTPY